MENPEITAAMPRSELVEDAAQTAQKRMNERLSDLLSELTTFKGQENLTAKQRELLASIMDLY
jgi:hypothetical protein